MKTNQLMTLEFSGRNIEIEHKTLYGSLTKVLSAANVYRVVDNEGSAVRIANVLSSDGFNKQVELLKADDSFKLDYRGAWYKTGRGRSTDTRAHLMLLVYVAEIVSSRFLYEMNKRLVLSDLLKLRDNGGNEFKTLNIIIDEYLLEGVENKRSYYIEVAKRMRFKIFGIEWNPEKQGNIWNSTLATADKHVIRAEYEAKLVDYMRIGYIDSYHKLLDVLDKL